MNLTVADAVAGRVDAPSGKWVYTVTAGDVVLYVGQTNNPRRRLRQHFTLPGCIAWYASPLTNLAHDNWGEAQQWQIALAPIDGDLDRAEADLIRELRPCLNCQHSDGSTHVPEHLLNARHERDAIRIAKFRQRRSAL